MSILAGDKYKHKYFRIRTFLLLSCAGLLFAASDLLVNFVPMDYVELALVRSPIQLVIGTLCLICTCQWPWWPETASRRQKVFLVLYVSNIAITYIFNKECCYYFYILGTTFRYLCAMLVIIVSSITPGRHTSNWFNNSSFHHDLVLHYTQV